MRLRAYTPFFAGRFCMGFETVGFLAELSKISFCGHSSSCRRRGGEYLVRSTSVLF